MSEVSIDDCWIWAGKFNGRNHARVSTKIDGVWRNLSGHRVVYEAVVGKIPDGQPLKHGCKVKQCVNPEHLEPIPKPETLTSKICSTCRLLKPIEEFSINRRVNKLRHINCRECKNKYYRVWQKEATHSARYKKARQAREKAREYKAQIKKDACEQCGSTLELHMHHPDHNKPLDIVTLCRTCHDELHYNLRRGLFEPRGDKAGEK